MASGPRETVLREIDRVFNGGAVAGLAEGPLLGRFVAGGDERAFEALVARHGPMVLGVCRRSLRDPHDVADAFQATFLVLVRKASSLRDAEQVGPWLHGVACRVAARTRSDSARRLERERRGARGEAVEDPPVMDRDALRGPLDEEIARLPEKYRRPVVLCYLQGQTHEEAARRLRCTPGALRGRLDRARARLRSRLLRRGLAPAASLSAAGFLHEPASAAVPATLTAATLANVGRIMAGTAVASEIPAALTRLADGVLKTMFLARFKLAALFLILATGAVVAGAWTRTLARVEKDGLPAEPPARNAALPLPLPIPKAPPDGAPAREPGVGNVAGRVLDRDGRPIEGARVALGADRHWADLLEATTDARGDFVFRGIKAGGPILTAQARGHAPDLKHLPAGPNREPVEFRLGPGRTIRGRIVDLSGKPIAGAPVSADLWRGARSLRWDGVTDADGWFRWDDGPSDSVTIDIGSLGYSSKRFITARPDAPERTIKMPRPMFVRGAVTDATTGEPIASFTLTMGLAGDGGQAPNWEYADARSLSDGSYEAKLDAGYRAFVRFLRVEAEGYLPAVSPGFRDDDSGRDQIFDFRLKRGDWIVGAVREPDGTLLDGADVLVVPPSQRAFIHNGRPPDPAPYHLRLVKTGADGRFTFPKLETPFTIFALHDRGFAERTSDQLAAGRDITLFPWGRIEGTLRVGARPGAGQPLYFSIRQGDPSKETAAFFDGETKADASGRFAFDRALPGSADVSRKLATGRLTAVYTQWVNVEVSTGRTAEVTLGGKGRPVVGRVDVPAGLAGRVDWAYSTNTIRARPTMVTPPPELDAEGRKAWREAWARSDEGRKALRDSQRSYGIAVKPDGSFRVDDVEPGAYELIIQADEPPPEKDCSIGGDALGTSRRVFNVPEIPGGRSDEPLDLGTLTMEPARKPRDVPVGSLAPGFRVETLDGKTLSLDDLKGKFVLLDFWAAWCDPCLAETPHLKSTFDAFGRDGRFAMIGLSLDRDRDAPRRYAAEHKMAWPQGFLGDWSEARLPEDFGIRSIPSIWLIGPDGKVIARDLRGVAIEEAVTTALGRPH